MVKKTYLLDEEVMINIGRVRYEHLGYFACFLLSADSHRVGNNRTANTIEERR